MHSTIYMYPDSTKCLLTSLQQLNDEVAERHTLFETTGYNFFGFPNKKEKVQEIKIDKTRFIHLMTVEEVDEIKSSKTKITTCLKQLESMEVKPFEKQKEITRRCYDVYSKYRDL